MDDSTLKAAGPGAPIDVSYVPERFEPRYIYHAGEVSLTGFELCPAWTIGLLNIDQLAVTKELSRFGHQGQDLGDIAAIGGIAARLQKLDVPFRVVGECLPARIDGPCDEAPIAADESSRAFERAIGVESVMCAVSDRGSKALHFVAPFQPAEVCILPRQGRCAPARFKNPLRKRDDAQPRCWDLRAASLLNKFMPIVHFPLPLPTPGEANAAEKEHGNGFNL